MIYVLFFLWFVFVMAMNAVNEDAYLEGEFKRHFEAVTEKILSPVNTFLIFLSEKVFNPMGTFIAYTMWEKIEEFLKVTFTKSNDEDSLIS